MFGVMWKVDVRGGGEGTMFLADSKRMWSPDVEQTSILNKALAFDTIPEAEAAAVLYGAKNPELIGRFKVVTIRFKDDGYGKMRPYYTEV